MRQIKIPNITGLPINEKYITIGHPNRPGDKLEVDIWEAIVFHETANFNPTASDLMHVGYVGRPFKKIGDNFYEQDGKKDFVYGAAQVFIDEDSVSLPIPLDERTHGAGDINLPASNGFNGQTQLAAERFGHKQNRKCLHVEMCDNADWEKVQTNTVEFIANLLVVNNVVPNSDYFIRHYDLTRKVCPSRFVDLTIVEVDPRWVKFKQRILDRYKELTTVKEVVNMVPQWKVDGVNYLKQKGYITSDHDPEESLDFGELGAIIQKLDKIWEQKLVDRSVELINRLTKNGGR